MWCLRGILQSQQASQASLEGGCGYCHPFSLQHGRTDCLPVPSCTQNCCNWLLEIVEANTHCKVKACSFPSKLVPQKPTQSQSKAVATFAATCSTGQYKAVKRQTPGSAYDPTSQISFGKVCQQVVVLQQHSVAYLGQCSFQH